MAAEPIPQVPPSEQSGYAGGPEMTLIDHLKELRNRVIICAIAVVLGVIICAVFWETIIGWLNAPARQEIPDFKPAVFSPVETIGIMIKVAMYGGLLLASPVVIYELLMFIVPGLTPSERKILLPGLAGVVFFLLLGMAFAYWVILPTSLGFLLNFGSDEFDKVIQAKAYYDFALRIIFFVGIAFELPMVLMLAARVGLVRARQLIGFWRYALIIIVIAAAIITPTPDPINCSLVAAPLFFLYFVGILLAWLVQKKPQPLASAPI